MSSLSNKIESLLLVSAKPLSISELSKFLKVDEEQVKEAITSLQEHYNKKDQGIHVLFNSGKVQFSTNPDHAKLVKEFMHDETTGELTKPSLETLTIIAYRQPVSKEELEQIRGVNCSLILRNLLIRGLIEAKESHGGLTVNYSVTIDFLRFLGIASVAELPDYEKLNSDENLQAVLNPSASASPERDGQLEEQELKNERTEELKNERTEELKNERTEELKNEE